MTLYVDVLFAVNFSMDFFSLFLCSKILKNKLHRLRIVLSATIGGIFGVLCVVLSLNLLLEVILCVIFALLMTIIAFPNKKIKHIAINTIVYWAISSLLGGIMSFLYSFANKFLSKYIAMYEYENVYTGARFLIIATLSILIASVFGKIFFNKKEQKTAHVKIVFMNKEYELTGLCDSGNLLKDPLSDKDVILVAKDTNIAIKIESLDDIYKRFIPFQDISQKGMLKGVIPQKILIEDKEVSAIVAPAKQDSFGNTDALIPASLL